MLKREVQNYLAPIILLCPCFFFMEESSFNRNDTYCCVAERLFSGGTSLICLDNRGSR